jgi:RHS repeat-associated protein
MRAGIVIHRSLGVTTTLVLLLAGVTILPSPASAASKTRSASTSTAGPHAPYRRSAITVGTAPKPTAVRPGATGFAAAAAASVIDTITFSELPVGVPVSTQYQGAGIIFGGDNPFISTDGSNPTSPVLSGTPQFQGAINGAFVQPDGTPRTVSGFTVDVGYIDNPGSTEVVAYDVNGAVLETVPVNGFGIVTITVSHAGIRSFRVQITSVESAGFAIDNLSFEGYPLTNGPTPGEQGGPGNPSERPTTCTVGEPVNCATGEFFHQFTDISLPGRGPRLEFARTYSVALAAQDGPLGHGWTFPYGMSVHVAADGSVEVRQENGSTVTFAPDGAGGYTAPTRVLATLTNPADGTFVFTRLQDHVQHVFAPTGLLTAVRDRNGYQLDMTYQSGQLTNVTDESGRSLTLTWAGGHISAVTDPEGRQVSFAYSPDGDLTGATSRAGRTWSFAYRSDHLMTSMTDPRGHGVTNVFDGGGRVVSQTDRAGLTSTWSYAGDPASLSGATTTLTDEHANVATFAYVGMQLVAVTHGFGTSAAATTRYGYDSQTLGRTLITLPDGTKTSNSFDSHGNLLSTVDPLSHVTSYTYDAADQLTSRTSPGGGTTTFSLDSRGNLLQLTDPLGHSTTYAYGDAAHPGDMTSVIDPDGRTRGLGYDSDGNLTSVTVHPSAGETITTSSVYDRDGERVCAASASAVAAGTTCPALGSPRVAGTATTIYNTDGQPTSRTSPTGGTTTYGYDADGNRTAITDPDGQVIGATYDGDDRLLTQTRAGDTTTHAYDLAPASCGASVPDATYCTTVTNPKGHSTTDWFTSRGELLAEQRPGGGITRHTYDLLGRETSRLDPAGRTTTYGHDLAGRLTSIAYSDGTTAPVSYGYDPDGRRVSMSDGTGTTTSAFDAAGRLLSRTDGSGRTVSYAYDGAGNERSLTYPSGHQVTHIFDGASRMVSLTDWSARTTSFTYDPDGRIVSTRYPNGDTVASTYDKSGLLVSTAVAPTADPGSPLGGLTLSRDSAGLVTDETDTGALAGSHTFGYDSKAQLNAVDASALGYDAAGNPTALPGRTQTFNSADELTGATAASASVTYSYDALGERTTATASSGGPSFGYGYDQSGRLTAVSRPAPVPTVSSVAPASGPLAGGTTVTITGTGLTGATAVRFGTGVATFLVRSDTEVSATAPAGSGSVSVTVTTPGGTSTGGAQSTFTYLPVPTVKKVTPTSGAAGTAVSITGTGFTQVFDVRFGAVSAQFTVTSATALSAIAPAGVGTVAVTVVTPGGTSVTTNSTRFTYPPSTSPVVTGLSPSAGPEAGGTLVTISGSGLSGATSVTFGGTSASSFSVKSATSVTAVAPAGSGAVSVKVTTPTGTSPPSSASTYTYFPRPAVTAISPTVGSTGGGTSVTITGTGFLGATAVSFGAKAATAFSIGSATSIVATSPSGTKTVDVTVVTPGGRSPVVAADKFTYSRTVAPAVSAAAQQQAAAAVVLPAGNVLVAAYTYDGEGLRLSRLAPFSAQAFSWDVTAPVPLMLTDGVDEFVYGPDGTAVEQVDAADAAAYYVHDALGSTRALLSGAGAVVATYRYDAYGQTLGATGSVSTPLRYAGYYADTDTGLYYLHARYYDPASAQFLTRDPLESLSGTAYGYAGNNPVNASDPNGLFCWSPSCLIQDVAIGAAAVAVVAAVVVLAPEITVGAVITVTVEETAAVVVAETGEVVVAATVATTVEATAITTATIAESVGTAATYAGFAAGAAKVVDQCSGGRTPECVAAIKELGTDFAFGAVGKLLDSPLYEFFDALREFENAVAGESGIPC